MIKNDNKIWRDLADKVAEKGGDGDAFVRELQDLYSIFTPDFATWIGGLYNHEIGGFHAANSGRDTEGIYPDIESTFQAVNTIASVGIVKKATDLPPVMRERMIAYISSLQSPEDGYIYHPQWNYNDPDWRLRDSRVGRDMMWAIALQDELDFKLPYPTANDRLEALASGEKTDAKLPDHLTSREAFIAYLDKLDWVNDAYFAGNMMAAQAGQIKAAGLAPTAAEYLGKIQNPENGLWGKYDSYDGVNALLKIAAFYSAVGIPIPNAQAAVESTLKCTCAPLDKKRATVCWQYNVWFALQYLVRNIRKCDGDAAADALIKRMMSFAPEAIRATKEKLEIFKLPDCSFTYMFEISSTRSQGALVASPTEGVLEGNVNASVICLHRTVEALLNAFGLDMPPIYDEEDYKLFLAAVKKHNVNICL